MKQATSEIRDLAQLVLAQEADQCAHAGGDVDAALSAFGKIRTYLAKLVGIAGFQALLARALALATVEVSWLKAVRVQADAHLDGFREAAQSQAPQAVAAGSTALLGQLIGLLVTFIGEALTLRLVQDIWPDSQGDYSNLSAKETPA